VNKKQMWRELNRDAEAEEAKDMKKHEFSEQGRRRRNNEEGDKEKEIEKKAKVRRNGNFRSL
jgi:hypothetical protein